MTNALAQPRSTLWLRGIPSFLLIILTIVPYLPARHAGWFFDSLILLDKPDFHSVPVAARELWDGKWVPDQSLSILTFSLNGAVNEAVGRDRSDPRLFIAVNIAIHAASVLLVYALVVALGQAGGLGLHPLIPLLVAAIFAVHPLNVTSVTYIVQRRGVLATAFYLAALVAYLRGRRTSGRRLILWALLTIALAWAAMHAKRMGATLPAAILALEFCLRATDAGQVRRFLRLAIPGLICCGLAAFLLLWSVGSLDVSHWRFKGPQTMVGELGFTWAQYLLTQTRAFARYWALILWPAPSVLCVDHDYRITWNYLDWLAWSCVFLHLGLIGFGVWMARGGRLLVAFGIFLYYVALIPWIAPPQPILFVEYRLYLPLVGAVLVAAGMLQTALSRIGPRPIALTGCLLVVLLATITWQRNTVMADSGLVWQDVVAKNPDLFRGHYNLANYLYQAGRFEEAVGHYREAARIDPVDYRCHLNLANSLMKLGRRSEAVSEYQETLLRKPDHSGAHAALQRMGLDVQIAPGNSPGRQ